MTTPRHEVIAIIERLYDSVSEVTFDVDYEMNSEALVGFSEDETIALENIVEESIVLQDYLINFFATVNGGG